MTSLPTSRQRQILTLMANGLTRAETARRLHASVESVKGHLYSARRGLDTRCTTHSIARVFADDVRGVAEAWNGHAPPKLLADLRRLADEWGPR